MYFVYAIKSKRLNRIYVGLTKNLQVRIREHNFGKTKSTKFYRPWVLFYSEEFDTRILARRREIQLKSGYGKEFLRKILNIRPCSSDG